MEKEQKKDIQHKILLAFLYLLRTVRYLPLGCSYALGSLLGNLGFVLLSRHRRVSWQSLSLAFPDWSFRRKLNVSHYYFSFAAQSILESFYFFRSPGKIDFFPVEGIEHLDAALAKNKGVVGVTAHLGAFPFLAWKLARMNYPVSIVARPFRDRYMGELFEKEIADTGVNIIYSYPRQRCVRNIFQRLKRNEIVIILTDQNFGTNGVWVEFFGKLAATPVGALLTAVKTGAALVPMYTVRTGMGRHANFILPEFKPLPFDDEDKQTLENSIRISKLIEGWIRENPFQWTWIHRRWKSRPSAKVLSRKYKVQGQ